MRKIRASVFAGIAVTACTTQYVNMDSKTGKSPAPSTTSGGAADTDDGLDGGPAQDSGIGIDSGTTGDGGPMVDGGSVQDAGNCTGLASDFSLETTYSGMNVYGTPYSYFVGASGDLNGDGLLDLVFAEFVLFPGDGGLDVFFGLPDGGLSAATSYAGSDGQSVAILDLDGDGIPDVVASTVLGVNVFLNDGEGGLLPPVFSGTTNQVLGIAGGDLNGDGLPDLVLSESNGAEYLLGLGAGSFSAPVALPGQGSIFGSLAVADLNADGLADIALNSSDGTALLILISQGDGGFTSTSYPTPIAGQIVVLPGQPTAPDLAFTSGSGGGFGLWDIGQEVEVFHNSGTGVFTSTTYPVASIWVTVGDYNGDCIPDLATSAYYWQELCPQPDAGLLAILYGDGDGGFSAPMSIPNSGAELAALLLPLGSVANPPALATGGQECLQGLTVFGDPSQH